MVCPECLSENFIVINSRHKGGTVYRRRSCNNCGNRFTTYEIDEKKIAELNHLAGMLKKATMEILNNG